MQMTLNKKQLALGLEWSIAPTESEMRAEGKRHPKAHRAIVRRADQIWLGLYAEPYKGTVYAGALVVGLIEPNSVVCVQVNEDTYWMCAVLDGMPVVGYDKFVPAENARSLAMDWFSQFKQSSVIGGLNGAKRSLDDLMNALDEAIEKKEITAKQLASLRVAPQTTPVSSIAMLLVLMSLPVAGYFGWQHWKKVSAAQHNQKITVSKLADEVINAEKLAAQRKLATENFHKAVAAKRAEIAALTQNSSRPVWAEWERVRTSIPLSSRGFTPQKMECDDKVCQVSWAAEGALTRPADKLALPGVLVDFDPSLTAKSEYPIPTEVSNVAKQGGNAATNAAELRFAIANAMGSFATVQVEPMQAAVVTPPPDLGLPPKTLGGIGAWKVVLADKYSLIQADDFLRRLHAWPMRVTKVRYIGLGHALSAQPGQPFLGGPSQSLAIEFEGTYGFAQPGEAGL